MAKKVSDKKKYKVVDVARFKESFSDSVPHYHKLSKGEEVELPSEDKNTKNWIANNILKEAK